VKENSIERDIHLLESYAGMTHKMNDNQGRPKLDQAIEHILSDYKRVLKENEELLEVKVSASAHNRILELEKENEELKADNYELNNRITDLLENIPVQKIKDKIEELKKKVEELTDEQGYWGGSDLLEQIKVLEEILEKEQ
jgi:hypothetical protein